MYYNGTHSTVLQQYRKHRGRLHPKTSGENVVLLMGIEQKSSFASANAKETMHKLRIIQSGTKDCKALGVQGETCDLTMQTPIIFSSIRCSISCTPHDNNEPGMVSVLFLQERFSTPLGNTCGDASS